MVRHLEPVGEGQGRRERRTGGRRETNRAGAAAAGLRWGNTSRTPKKAG